MQSLMNTSGNTTRSVGPTGPIDQSALNNYQMRGDSSMQASNPQNLFADSSLGEMFTGVMDGIFRTGGGQDTPVNLQTPVRQPTTRQPDPVAPSMPAAADDQRWYRGRDGEVYMADMLGTGDRNFTINTGVGGPVEMRGTTHGTMDDFNDPMVYRTQGDMSGQPNKDLHFGSLLTEDENRMQNRMYALEQASAQHPLQRPDTPPSGLSMGGQLPAGPQAGSPAPPPDMVPIPGSLTDTSTLDQPAAGPNAWGMMDMSGAFNEDFINSLMSTYGA